MDFEHYRRQIERQGRMVRRAAGIIFVISTLMFVSAISLGIYALVYPEVVGEFVGRIFNGFESTR